jgi:hypothetical protein
MVALHSVWASRARRYSINMMQQCGRWVEGATVTIDTFRERLLDLGIAFPNWERFATVSPIQSVGEDFCEGASSSSCSVVRR